MQPLISIIIPTYNRAHLIGETLDSVLAQTYQNWECIVIDDGSIDDTDAILSKYVEKDHRLTYYLRPDSHLQGGNGARNYGIYKSKGEYINFLDSDDELHSKALEIKVAKALEYNVDIVISKNCRNKNELNPNINKIENFISATFDINFILSRNAILIGEPFIKKSAIEVIEFDESLVRSQDFDFLLRLFRQKLSYCRIDAILYYYRNNANSISRKASSGKAKESKTQLLMMKRNLEYYKGNIQIENETKRTIRKMYIALMKKKRIDRILENYNFYRKGFELTFIKFGLYFIINLLTQKGYDRMRK